MASEKAIRIVIYVDGGVVHDVVADASGVVVMIVDYDNEKQGDDRQDRYFDPVTVNVDYIKTTIQGTED